MLDIGTDQSLHNLISTVKIFLPTYFLMVLIYLFFYHPVLWWKKRFVKLKSM